MKTIVCHCVQCQAARKEVRKRNRIQTCQVRAARHKIKQMLRCYDPEIVEDYLQTRVSVDYYG